MKCLLCKFKSNDKLEIENHYLNFHNVDKDNVFFQRLFDEKNNVFHGKRCLNCEEFIPTTKFKVSHDFLKHYEKGKKFVVEEKPISITKIGNINKYEINYQDHSSFYDFYDPVNLVEEFLFNVKNRIKRSNVDFFVRSGFSLENIQPVLDQYNEPLKNSRYWTTDPIQTKSFNDFVYFNIRESILKRVINNGLTGSSWHFNRFLYVNIKTLQMTDNNLKR